MFARTVVKPNLRARSMQIQPCQVDSTLLLRGFRRAMVGEAIRGMGATNRATDTLEA